MALVDGEAVNLTPTVEHPVNLGMAYSAGQFLLTCGTEGKRYALPHSKVLLHQGSAGIGGTAVDIELQADDLRHMRKVLGCVHRHLAQKPGGDITESRL